MGKVYLVGAGPGDAGLITVRGLELVKRCDAIVYDRLVSKELLLHVREDCRIIYVGKQAGHHEKTQEEINQILLDCAAQYNEVVRLKGGDPFVFGRGGEEAEALIVHGIDFEVVPGVTSAVAVPECAGIPVTHRGVSRSFHVITGHTNQGQPICNYEALAEAGGTLVFLMGLAHLEEIAEGLLAAGMDKNTNAAVISDGTTDRQRILRGTLEHIAQEVRERDMVSPAIIVIGEAAGLNYRSRITARRVGITATSHLYQKLSASFAAAGMQTVWVCRMEVHENKESGLVEVLAKLGSYHWVIFTSANGVKIFFDTAKRAQIDRRSFGHLKFAALGSGTAEKLAEYGIFADFVPSKYVTRIFAEELVHVVSEGENVLIPRAKEGNPRLTEILKQNGIAYTDLPVYDVKGTLSEQADELEELDYLVFASASGVRDFFRETQRKKICLPQGIKLACIGEVTAESLLQRGRAAEVVAKNYTVLGLTEAILEKESDVR